MTTIRDLFPSRYLSGEDLKGQDYTLTMRRVVEEEMQVAKNEKGVKAVLYFQEAKKGMVLNKTNALVIAQLYGNVIEEWTGKRITIHPKRERAFGNDWVVIRIRPERPEAATPATPPPDEDDHEEATDEQGAQQAEAPPPPPPTSSALPDDWDAFTDWVNEDAFPGFATAAELRAALVAHLNNDHRDDPNWKPLAAERIKFPADAEKIRTLREIALGISAEREANTRERVSA
jgi:hypothetical protein